MTGDEDCYVTFEQTESRLEAIERRLADELHLPHGTARLELIRLCKAGELEETDLVQDWLGLYSSFVHWESWDDAPPDEVVP